MTLEELSAQALARDPSRPALEFEGQWIGWGEMRQLAERLWSLIDAAGVPAQAAIAFVPRNRPSAVAALLAMIAKSHSPRMIYVFQSPAGIAREIEKLKPPMVVAAAQEFSPEVLAVLKAHGIAGAALEEMDSKAVPGCERSHVVPDPEAPRRQIEILTSGTTGPPKRFRVDFDMIATHFLGINPVSSEKVVDYAQQPPMLLCVALGNISGICSTLPPMLNGQRAILVDKFTVAAWHDYVRRYHPVLTGLPPAGVQMVLDANLPQKDLASIRALGTGAAPVDPTVHRAFEKKYGIPVLLSYGATEFAGPVTAMSVELHAEWGEKKFGSVGRVLGGAQVRVIDPETGAVLPPGQEGILEAITPRIGSHWIRTTDVALLDEDGFLFIRGRADGAIMRGGFKLLPETIERALVLHESVSAAGVVGIADRRLGQVPAAAIQLKPEAEKPSVAELEKHLRNHVLATHIPVAWRFVEALPLTPSFKVDRPALCRMFEDSTTS